MEDAHIFDVEVGVPCTHAAGPVETGLNESALRVKVVDDWVGIFLLTCSEDHDLEVLVGRLETLPGEGSDIYSSQDWLRLFRKLDWNDNVRVIIVNVIHTVNQGLIKVKDDSLGLTGMIGLWQVNQ